MKSFTETTVEKLLAQRYPHLRYPAVLYARVSNRRECGAYCEYTLRLTDSFGMPDDCFPAIPDVRARACFEPGTLIAVALAYGELLPYILGEVIL